MEKYTQANRPLIVRTPLPNDDLLIERIWGYEEMNSLFTFQLDLFAENEKDIPFDKMLGAEVTVELKFGVHGSRFFSGIVCQFSQAGRDTVFTAYQAELVPRFWLLTKTTHSRIFQQKTVPQILEEVLENINPVYDIGGSWHSREYCVQYRETDFNFACRLMEEEGIYYFFDHSADSHRMVVSNKAGHLPARTGTQ
jgi:type VI secretion system secreted protein VgrG